MKIGSVIAKSISRSDSKSYISVFVNRNISQKPQMNSSRKRILRNSLCSVLQQVVSNSKIKLIFLIIQVIGFDKRIVIFFCKAELTNIYSIFFNSVMMIQFFLVRDL